jgi:hypothetical protein
MAEMLVPELCVAVSGDVGTVKFPVYTTTPFTTRAFVPDPASVVVEPAPEIAYRPNTSVEAVALAPAGAPDATETPLRYKVTVFVLCLYVTAT